MCIWSHSKRKKKDGETVKKKDGERACGRERVRERIKIVRPFV